MRRAQSRSSPMLAKKVFGGKKPREKSFAISADDIRKYL